MKCYFPLLRFVNKKTNRAHILRAARKQHSFVLLIKCEAILTLLEGILAKTTKI